MSSGARYRRRSALLLASLGSEDSSEANGLGQALTKQAYEVACVLPRGWQVLPGLCKGEPAIERAIAKLDSDIEELIVVPMYPQYAYVTSGAVMREVYRVMGELRKPLDLISRTQWHDDAGYVNAQARLIASFTSSVDLNLEQMHLVLIAPALWGDSEEDAGDSYEQQVDRTSFLVLERLGWPTSRSSIAYQPMASPMSECWGELTNQLHGLAESGCKTIAIFPIAYPAGCTTGLDRLQQQSHSTSKAQVLIGPAIDTYGPFITAVKNLAVRGPRSVTPGMSVSTPLMAPEESTAHLETTPGSLVMIGASITGKVRAEHGPDVVHSPPGVFCEVKKTRRELRAFLDWVREETPVEEAFVWSTCQRIEFFGWHSQAEDMADHEWPIAEIRQHLYGAEPEGLKVNVLFGVEAWHHLLRTACGLNSALPGDTDIVDQLQTSCRMGERIGTVGMKAASLVNDAVALAEEVRKSTEWHRFSRGFCGAALSRVHDLSGADLERCKHVVIGGSATSRSVLFTLKERFRVPSRRMTLVYRDHHGQMKLLRTAIGNGRRLRVHRYSEPGVIKAIADADFVFFGIDHSEPVISAEMLEGIRDFGARPLVVIDFNDSGSVDDLDKIPGISVWTADDLDRAVDSYADSMCADIRFASAVEQAERWIEARLSGGEDG